VTVTTKGGASEEETAAPASADVPATAQKAPVAAKAAAPAAKGGDKKK
jgi:hypothetical protein